MDPKTDHISEVGDEIEEMLNARTDVSNVERVSIGIIGFVLDGVGDMSLALNQTGESPL